jgi:hypothetical protein
MASSSRSSWVAPLRCFKPGGIAGGQWPLATFAAAVRGTRSRSNARGKSDSEDEARHQFFVDDSSGSSLSVISTRSQLLVLLSVFTRPVVRPTKIARPNPLHRQVLQKTARDPVHRPHPLVYESPLHPTIPYTPADPSRMNFVWVRQNLLDTPSLSSISVEEHLSIPHGPAPSHSTRTVHSTTETIIRRVESPLRAAQCDN